MNIILLKMNFVVIKYYQRVLENFIENFLINLKDFLKLFRYMPHHQRRTLFSNAIFNQMISHPLKTKKMVEKG